MKQAVFRTVRTSSHALASAESRPSRRLAAWRSKQDPRVFYVPGGRSLVEVHIPYAPTQQATERDRTLNPESGYDRALRSADRATSVPVLRDQFGIPSGYETALARLRRGAR